MEFLFRLSAHLPLRVLHALGGCLGWLVFAASPSYRRRFRENARLAGLSAGQVRGAIAAAGRLVTETPWLWLRSQDVKRMRVRLDGGEHIEAALARGHGVIMLTPHLGSFEACAQAAACHLAARNGPMTVLYKPSRFDWLQAVMRRARSAPGLTAAPTSTGGVRLLMKTLKEGRMVGLLPDQVPPEGLGVWAPFFGRAAYTMTLASRLSRQTGAPLLLAWGDRLPGGRGFVVRVEPQEVPAGATPQEAAVLLNERMEALIRRHPHLYLWGYARYKQPRSEA